jgi:flavin reductase (DIM6/NTAB) family NADH-FMN oxidoreductase RutF
MTTTVSAQLAFRRALGQFATGVTVVTVEYAPGKIHGMTANSFTSVSLDPLTILICVDHRALLFPMLQQQQRFGVSVLKEHQQALAEFFAQPEQDEHTEGRLNVRFRRSPNGTPMLEDTLTQLSCRVAGSHVSGDHTIFLGAVETVEAHEGQPLLFFRGRYRQVAGGEG